MIKISDIIIEDGTNNLSIDKARTTIRAVIYKNKQLLMVYAHQFKDYTFPGGGMKKDEDHMLALKREIKEELGANQVLNIKPLGYIEEKRYGLSQKPTVYLQTSYYYFADVEEFGEQSLAEREKEHGVEPVWIAIDEAIAINKKSIETYNHKRGMKTVLPREMAVLNYLKEYFKE
ncbi:MAG: NUDIX domain-containing protein [Acholeplasma sp.]